MHGVDFLYTDDLGLTAKFDAFLKKKSTAVS